MAQDIFDMGNIDSLVRRILREKGSIDLNEFDIPTYEIKDNYTSKEFNFSSDRKVYAKEVRNAIGSVVEEAEAQGYNANFFTALYEAVLNAHQHGNKLDTSKTVTLAYKIANDTLEIAVIDQGGKLDPEFIPYVLKHKQNKDLLQKQFIDFYQFTNRVKPNTNNGTGTSFMHTYVDNVQYFKSTQGGLVVHLTILNKN
ncbi:ATP-binding protein [Candidatus Woesearchaeota archaeon]|nr:ATP-binding protein [Candidatus Woesearchaeota archaeon]